MPSPARNARDCPSEQVLAAYLRAELSPSERETIQSHIANCPECGSRVGSDAGVETRDLRSDLREDFSVSGSSVATKSGVNLPRIGQYQLIEQIGRGGMGVVYRAQHLHLKRKVALKLLSDRRLIDARAVARFEREMEIVGRLDHPNIVRASDAGYADGYHYLAMELIDGCNLAQLLRGRAALPVPEACEMIRQAAIALEHASEFGLVHRDIKPNNLMLTASGVVKVLDLGLARLGRGEEGGSLTGSGGVMGTPDYMAPEQWDSSRDVDIRADIYSLGCTLHTLLVQHPPFSGDGLDTASRKMAAHLRAASPRLGSVRPDVPAALQAVVDRAMAKNADERFQKPGDFAEALSEFAREADLSSLARSEMSRRRDGDAPFAEQNHENATTANHLRHPGTETPGSVLPDTNRRLHRRVWMAAGTLAIALAVVAAAFPAIWKGREPQPDLSVAKPRLRPKPNEWFDLLASEPVKAVWPKGKADTESAWKYDGPNGELWVHAVERVMIELEEVGDVDFALECTISQHPWRGNIGVYFADRTAGAGRRADVIALDGFDFTKAAPEVPLTRGRLEHERTEFKTSIIDHTIRVPNPVGASCRLWLAAYRNGEILVQWEGQKQAAILRPRENATSRGTAGAIGVYVQDSTAVFRQARLRILTPNL